MTKSRLIIGPSYLNGLPKEEDLALLRSNLNDAGALQIFDVWVSMAKTGIPKKEDMDPLLFFKLLPQVMIEELDPVSGESILKLAGEFYKELYTVSANTLYLPYYDQMPQQDIIDDWVKSDVGIHQNHCPTLQFFNLHSIGKEYINLAEFCLPVLTKNNIVQSFGYTWKTD